MAAPLTIVIFGASGDLTARKLVPALFRLAAKGRLPEGTQIVGVARSPFTDESFRAELAGKVREAFGKDEPWDDAAWAQFARRLHYVSADAGKPEGMGHLADRLREREGPGGGDRLYYLSVAPELYPVIATRLGEAGMNQEQGGFRRLVIEKPFGTDKASARQLNDVLHRYFREEQIYRIDHYLGKETVQNILVFRFANTLWEPLWSNKFIDHVQITVAESVPVGRRGSYYDKSGVLRDMFQSHLVQVLTMVAMEAPARFNADSLRNEKMKVLDAVTIPPPGGGDDVMGAACQQVATGQYAGYLKEPGVAPDTKTPTFAAVRLHVDNWRWRGVPFFLRSGKALRRRYSDVTVQFLCPPHLMFPLPKGEVLQCNRLTLRLQPNEGISLNFETKVPDREGVQLKPADLAFDYAEAYGTSALPEAYERLLLDAVHGDATLFMRADEIERAWEIMDPLIAATERPDAPRPETYAVGSDGPAGAERLLTCDGRKWLNPG
jgi:glucose-6-phosphate 1-dehydrogenase